MNVNDPNQGGGGGGGGGGGCFKIIEVKLRKDVPA